MFAVPGWSVPAESLKAQTTVLKADPAAPGGEDRDDGGGKKTKKRKRGHGKNVEVTGANLSELWARCFEGRSGGNGEEKVDDASEGRKKKKKKKSQRDDMQVTGMDGGDVHNGSEKADEGADAMDAYFVKNDAVESISRESETSKEPPTTGDGVPEDDDGRAKYERRKAKAERRREQRAQKEANGELPPPRPEANAQGVTSKAQSKKANKAEKAAAKQSAIQRSGSNITKSSVSSNGHLDTTTTTTTPTTAPTPQSTTTTTKLTPLQTKMAAKLTSARFRHLNETLYTTPSSASLSLFTSKPSAYTSYHAGFRAQVAVWPSNPIDDFIADVKARGAVRVARHGHGYESQAKAFRAVKRGAGGKGMKKSEHSLKEAETEMETQQLQPLPRTNGICTIADFGCGDAKLAGSLLPLNSPSKLNLKIHSFDLSPGTSPNSHLITVADCANDLTSVGIRPGSVDIVICCLSLMGTNWVGCVEECKRVVREGGEVWVAEIRSRFVRKGERGRVVGKGDGDVMGRKKGKGKGKGGKKGGAEEGEEDDEDEGEEQDLEDAPRTTNETDLTAFIAIWQKRGFSLSREPDVSNKMFVKIWFVKTERPPSLGQRAGAGAGDGVRGEKKGGKKFIERDDGEDEGGNVGVGVDEEGKVLKACLYKTR